MVFVDETSFITAHCNYSDAYHLWTGAVIIRLISTLPQLELSIKQNN